MSLYLVLTRLAVVVVVLLPGDLNKNETKKYEHSLVCREDPALMTTAGA